MIVSQDSEVILLDQYEWTGNADGIYLKTPHYTWMESNIGGLYKVLLNRIDRSLIYIANEHTIAKYAAIEPSLVGDVLILGMGLALLDSYLTTGTNWQWVEKNELLYDTVTPVNGSVARGDAEDEDLLTFLGTFDTILIDFPKSNDKIIDYTPYLNPGGTIIEMRL